MQGLLQVVGNDIFGVASALCLAGWPPHFSTGPLDRPVSSVGPAIMGGVSQCQSIQPAGVGGVVSGAHFVPSKGCASRYEEMVIRALQVFPRRGYPCNPRFSIPTPYFWSPQSQQAFVETSSL